MKGFCYLCVFFFLISGNSFSQTIFISFQDPHISYEGRIDFTKNAAKLMWSGTSIRINFKGTDISGEFKDSDTSDYYNLIIDNQIYSEVRFDTIKKNYVLAKGLPYGKHTLQLFKRTEWANGVTLFYGFATTQKIKLLQKPKRPKRKIEFFGNSITCGYAINDTVADSPAGYYEDNYDSYGAITARKFNAQYHCTAKSGIGVMVSWFPLIMPEMYDRLDPTDSSSRWNFSEYIPDVVVINLLQNDSWIVNIPDNPEFKKKFGTKPPSDEYIIESYKKFVETIRTVYPKTSIICMLGNMDITRKGSPWPAYVKKAVAELHDPSIFTYITPYKETKGHPKIEEQKRLAEGLIDFIRRHVDW